MFATSGALVLATYVGSLAAGPDDEEVRSAGIALGVSKAPILHTKNKKSISYQRKTVRFATYLPCAMQCRKLCKNL